MVLRCGGGVAPVAVMENYQQADGRIEVPEGITSVHERTGIYRRTFASPLLKSAFGRFCQFDTGQ